MKNYPFCINKEQENIEIMLNKQAKECDRLVLLCVWVEYFNWNKELPALFYFIKYVALYFCYFIEYSPALRFHASIFLGISSLFFCSTTFNSRLQSKKINISTQKRSASICKTYIRKMLAEMKSESFEEQKFEKRIAVMKNLFDTFQRFSKLDMI